MSATDLDQDRHSDPAEAAEEAARRLADTRAAREEFAESVDLAEDALAILRSAQVDTSTARGDLGAFTGVYSLGLVLLLGGVMVWSALRGTGFRLDHATFVADPTFVAVGSWFMSLGVCVLIAGATGPLGASKPMRSWLLTTPADRALLVRSRFTSVTILGGLFNAVAGAFGTAITQDRPPLIVSGALVGFLLGMLTVRLMAATQHRPGARVTAATVGYGSVGIASLTLTLGVLPGWSTVSRLRGSATADDGYELARDAILCLIALAGIRWTAPRIKESARAMPIGAFARGGDFVDALGISTVMLDSTHLRGVLSASSIRRHTVRPLRSWGVWALIEADLVLASRKRRALALMVATLPVPATIAALFGIPVGWMAALVIAYCVASMRGSGLSTWTRSDSLRHTLPFPAWQTRLALLVAPCLAVALWAAIALPLARVPFTHWPLLLVIVAAATLRAAGPRETASAGSGMIATPMGVFPVGLMMVLLRGIDILVLSGVLAAVGLPLPALVLSAAALVWMLTRAP